MRIAEEVRVTTANTDHAPYVGGTGGSKVVYTIGPAVLRAAEDARDQVVRIAAAELEASVDDLELIELATYLARVAIERDCAEEALRQSEGFLAEGQRISHTGTWGWNLSSGKVVWSE